MYFVNYSVMYYSVPFAQQCTLCTAVYFVYCNILCVFCVLWCTTVNFVYYGVLLCTLCTMEWWGHATLHVRRGMHCHSCQSMLHRVMEVIIKQTNNQLCLYVTAEIILSW